MMKREYATVICIALAASATLSIEASAKSFKAKYYKACYADVKEVSELVVPKESMSAKASKVSGLFGKVGSFAGIGGVGGSAYKAANVVNKVNKYSGMIDDVSAFRSQMVTDHPDPNDRFAAYGTYMSNEATDIEKVQAAVDASQACYEKEFDTLTAEVAAGDIKKRKAKKRFKEIRNGVEASGDVLIHAINRLNKNASSFNETLGSETQYMQVNQHYAALGIDPDAVQLAFKQANGQSPAMDTATAMAAQRAYERAVNVGQFNAAQVNSVSARGLGNLGMLSGLASAFGQKALSGDATPQMGTGLQEMAMSSQKYLAVQENLAGTIDKQRALELKVNQD